jgi:FkbM family methyltransferase
MNVKPLLRRSVSVLPPRIRGPLETRRLRWKVSHYPRRQVTHEYCGFSLRIHITDPLGEKWYDRDWDEKEEISLLRKHQLQPGARVFNLGAHQGVYALVLAKVVGPTGRVVALEANEHNARVATMNAELNSVEQLVVLHAAAGESTGELVFNEKLNSQVDTSGTWGAVRVPSFSVDELSRRFGTPQVLFIDVEGFECQVLRGARETLRARPDCFVEVHMQAEKFGGSFSELQSFFPPVDYDLFLAQDEAGHPEDRGFSPFDRERDPGPTKRSLLVALAREPHA